MLDKIERAYEIGKLANVPVTLTVLELGHLLNTIDELTKDIQSYTDRMNIWIAKYMEQKALADALDVRYKIITKALEDIETGQYQPPYWVEEIINTANQEIRDLDEREKVDDTED